MKRISVKMIVTSILMMVMSCDEPETIVTNYVHPDGSVTRKIEMRNSKNIFEKSGLQIPVDSTWAVRDSCEISINGDTTWIKRAVKEFKNVEEINLAYKSDSGAYKGVTRHAGFKKRFKWFNTEYRFSETIDKKLESGYPLSDFLNDEELLYFYSPASVNYIKEHGPDSLKYNALNDSIDLKTESWIIKVFVSEWIGEFYKLTEGRAGSNMTLESLKKREDEFVKIIEDNNQEFDSLWDNGILLREFIGEENALRFKADADTAVEAVTRNIFDDLSDYSVRIVMPGKVIGTNGFIDSSEVLLWPVKSDYFLTEPYEMWAESRLPNRWARILSVLFLVFVITGLVIKIIKRG